MGGSFLSPIVFVSFIGKDIYCLYIYFFFYLCTSNHKREKDDF